MHVVVVVRSLADDPGRAGEPGPRADEDHLGPRLQEAVDEVLRERPVDLARRGGFPLAAVPARVVDVDVEPVLVREVAEPPEAGAELATLPPAEIAHADTRDPRMGRAELGQHAQHRAHELGRCRSAARAGSGLGRAPGPT